MAFSWFAWYIILLGSEYTVPSGILLPKHPFLYQYLTAKATQVSEAQLSLDKSILSVILFISSYKSPQGDALHPLLRNWDKFELLVCSSPNPSFALPENQCDGYFLFFLIKLLKMYLKKKQHFFNHLQPRVEQKPI